MKTKLFLMCVTAASAVYSGAAMPTEAEVEKAVPKVERMLASEKVALESGKMTRAEVAAAAMKLSEDVDDEAAKLLLMKGAFILHVKDGNLEKAVKTMNALETAITDMPPQVVTNIIETAFAGAAKDEIARLYRLLDEKRKNDTSSVRQHARPKLAQFLDRESRVDKQRSELHSALQALRSTTGKASENTEEIDGYTWSYTVKNGEARIEARDARFGTGEIGVYRCAVSPKPTGHLEVPVTLGGVCVTGIGMLAFSGCANLTSVSIPSSVTRIEPGAFHGCSSLMKFSVAPNNPSYSVRNGMLLSKDGTILVAGGNGDVVIPSGVVKIGDWAFKGLAGLKSVRVPSSMTKIEIDAFSCCEGLMSITVDEANPTYRSIDGMLFSKDGRTLIRGVNGDVTIPSGVTSIEDEAFSQCRALKSVTIPSSVTNIGSCAFMGCSGLKSVTIPQGVTHIGGSAFVGCSKLASVTLPESVTSIVGIPFNKTPFYENMPNGQVILGGGVLCGYKGRCPSSLTIPSSVKVIGDNAFSGNNVLKSVTIQEGVKSIGSNAFSKCKGISSITIPSSVTSIDIYAFYKCAGLRSVKISSDVTNIGDCSFCDCSSLVSLTIPSTVTNIHDMAFESCPNLKSVDVVRNGIVKSVSFDDFVKTFKRDKNRPYEDGAKVGGYTWSYRTQNGEATITPSLGVRPVAAIPCAVSPNPTGDIEIPASLGGVRVTCIGWNAFRGCTNLTSVSIPSSVTRIEPGAFSGCSCLMRFSVDPANPSYSTKNGLLCSKDGADLVVGVNGDVEIPLGVKNIGGSAFHGRVGLKSVVMPASVTNVDISAFVDCSGLMSFAVDEGNATYCSRNGMLLSKDGVTLIVGVNGDVTIPLGVTSIRRGAFMGRDKLTAITIPEGVVSIGDSAFSRCGKLESVTIPASVTSIVANHRGSPFSECGELKSFLVDSSNPVYGSRNGLLCSKDGTTLFAGVNGDVVIPTGVTKIERGAFMGCGRLTSVTIPSGVTSIGDGAFFNCRGLTSVKIPPSVTKIGYGAFGSCLALTHLTIPSTVTNVAFNAFSGGEFCSLKTVDVVKEGNVETVTFEEFCKRWESKRPSVAPLLRSYRTDP